MEVKKTISYSVRVDSYRVLDTIQYNFPAFTRDGVSEAIVEADLLDHERFQLLANIVGATKKNPLPKGCIHFWK